jgi:hypothetical protein
LNRFFNDSDTKLGVFYPSPYLIAVLWNLETAQRAAKKLRLMGFAEDEVIAVPDGSLSEGRAFLESGRMAKHAGTP